MTLSDQACDELAGFLIESLLYAQRISKVDAAMMKGPLKAGIRERRGFIRTYFLEVLHTWFHEVGVGTSDLDKSHFAGKGATP